MSTYLEVQNRINNDYLNRTGFGSETKRAIQTAIRHYQYRRWTFNETSTAVTTSSSQSYVTLPSNFLILDELRITLNGESIPLNRREAIDIRDWNAGNTFGQPTDYAIYQNRIETFPVANSAYSLPIYYIKSLSALSADSDTNAWIQGGMEDVIVYHAAKLMWANVLRNDKETLKFNALEQTALSNMGGFMDQRSIGKIKSHGF